MITEKSDYYSPPVKSKFPRMSDFKNFIKQYYEQLKHAFSKHENVVKPKRQLPNLPKDLDDSAFELAKSLYDRALNSIKSAEEKGFKLLSYSTALLSVPLYLLSRKSEVIMLTSVFAWITFILTLLALIISFRCIHVKVLTVVDFEEIFQSNPLDKSSEQKLVYTYSRNALASKYIKLSFYNEAVANSIVDMIRAAQKTIVIGALFALMSLFTFAYAPTPQEEITVQNSLYHLEKRVNTQQSMISELRPIIQNQNKEITKLRCILDSVVKHQKSDLPHKGK